MRWFLAAAVALSAAIYLWLAGRESRSGKYIFKPLTTILILLVAATGLAAGLAPAGPGAGEAATAGALRYGGWILTGLAFSLAGDILLMLPNRFKAGLAAFLLAHLAYLVALTPTLALGWPDGLAWLVLGATVVLIYQRLRAGLVERGELGLSTPVLAYMLVISAMVWRALAGLWSPVAPAAVPALAAAGAVLFYLSDGALAWDRFVRPLPGRDALVMIPYYGGQLLIALSVAGW